MKKYLIFLVSMSVMALMVSCNKTLVSDEVSAEPQEIVIGLEDTFVVDTKATAITAIPSTMYWGASSGTDTETVKWATASGSVSSSKIATGKYQTATATAYNYYVANQTFTVAGDMTVANNNTDVIVGRTAASTSVTPAVTLNHIFARTGSLTCNTQSGYTISNVSWKIVGTGDVNGTAGTYNMKSQSWTAASTKLSSETTITSSSDMYLIPGSYTIKVTYTLTKGDYTKTFTKSGTVTLVGGKINNISCTAIGGNASDIQITLSLTAWSNQAVQLNLS